MKTIGIICEYNPLHNGHLYHINKVKELYPSSTIVLVLSGNFTQRGIVSILDKWTKTKLALEFGVDLVVELPFVFSTQSADIFAHGSISILNILKVDALVFGSESGNVDHLIEMANIQLTNIEYQNKIKNYLSMGINYPTALSKALTDISNSTVTTPNDLLGLSYIKEIIKLNAKIEPIAVKRTNNFHNLNIDSSVVSASAIRQALKDKKDISNTIPLKVKEQLDNHIFINDDYYPLLQYQILIKQNYLKNIQTVDEGIENRILNYILSSHSLDDLISNIKTKRYTYNKLMRMMIHILCDFTKDEAIALKDITYIRVLGLNSNGKNYLNSIKKDVDMPIITGCNEINDPMLAIEYRTTCIYASTLNQTEKELLIKHEYTKKPIIKED